MPRRNSSGGRNRRGRHEGQDQRQGRTSFRSRSSSQESQAVRRMAQQTPMQSYGSNHPEYRANQRHNLVDAGRSQRPTQQVISPPGPPPDPRLFGQTALSTDVHPPYPPSPSTIGSSRLPLRNQMNAVHVPGATPGPWSGNTAGTRTTGTGNNNSPQVASMRSSSSSLSSESAADESQNSSNRYICPYCSRRLTRRSNLNEHIRTQHTPNPRRWGCYLCESDFQREQELRRHLVEVHRQAPSQHKCRDCGQCFTRLESLQRHLNNASCPGLRA